MDRIIPISPWQLPKMLQDSCCANLRENSNCVSPIQPVKGIATNSRFRLRHLNIKGLVGSLLLLNLLVPRTISSEAIVKVTKFHVPQEASTGNSRKLTCTYELREATLHSVKMFKDNKEFYRYSPGDPEPKMAWEAPGINVDKSRSNEKEVWLKKIGPASAGLYKCQVSIEGTFKSDSAEKQMLVNESNRPLINGNMQYTRRPLGTGRHQSGMGESQFGAAYPPSSKSSRRLSQQQLSTSSSGSTSISSGLYWLAICFHWILLIGGDMRVAISILLSLLLMSLGSNI